MQYVRSERVSLKAHPEYSEKWLQQRLVEDVEVLGLGDLDVKDVERVQPRAGRLDLLLSDPDAARRYEVELQLGPTDESHIIRALEYWDNERRRFPQYDHVAVVVAEEVTGRFLNVISLFNQAIPLIAVELAALKVNDVLTLHATRVLDLALPALEEEDEPGQETDRGYWSGRSEPPIMSLLDRMLQMINGVGEPVSLKYKKHYVGLQHDGLADNFVTFRPRKKHLIAEFRIQMSDELDARIDAAGLTQIAYDKRWGRYRIQLKPADFDESKPVLGDLVRLARGIPADPLDSEAPLVTDSRTGLRE